MLPWVIGINMTFDILSFVSDVNTKLTAKYVSLASKKALLSLHEEIIDTIEKQPNIKDEHEKVKIDNILKSYRYSVQCIKEELPSLEEEVNILKKEIFYKENT